MRLIGVVDLLGGQAVHARRGERERYAPLGTGDAVELARRYIETFGLGELYVADIDAIVGREAQDAVISAVAGLPAQVWLDAGIASAERARDAQALGATHVVVGLETLASFTDLDAICETLGGDCVAFSLDVRDGEPVGAAAGTLAPPDIAARAAAAGVNSILLIDLARVGSERGIDVEMVARVREAVPDRLLVAGGGVRSLADLSRLADAGCDGALVATALHSGAISAADVLSARHFSVRR